VTKRFPATERWLQVCADIRADVGWIERLVPLVAEMARRGGPKLPAGSEGGGHPEGVHSDPTFSAVESRLHCGQESEWTPAHRSPVDEPAEGAPKVIDTPGGRFAQIQGRDEQGGPLEEEHDKQALLRVLAAFSRLRHDRDEIARALTGLKRRIPEMESALREGREATDGRSGAEIVALHQHSRAVRSPSTCAVCEHTFDRLWSGMCHRHYKAWDRFRAKTRAGDPRAWIANERARLRAGGEERDDGDEEWDNDRNFTIGPADGVDRRAA
jgi:hypothetical protein